ncbi:alpha/beta fold hydrolase [Pseudonocardia cypriaca]|uniref:ABC-2 type transport system ATP-binding protein n=1 Tax=Pseudonocardia cypriaca TaxID=882449 RepID=A0A543FTR2_9PSEU|nr:alpha/beta fold hydrolase [Pseudonocardia cypriaca]TQM37216.1 ABC-2 type transport system ATP-binding protein [Pseudonocardia cypriaca]
MHPVRGRLPSLALSVVLAVVAGIVLTGAAPADVRVTEERVATAEDVELDTSLYLPAVTPAPAVLVAHGFGGSKASVDADARALAARGFVVLTWSARGFGTSTGQIALDSPDAEVADARALVDRLATSPEVQQDGPGDPRVGVTGASYGGALALMLAGSDLRVDALAPVITWNDLGQALFPNAAAAARPPAATPAEGIFAPDGVFKSGWAGMLFSAGSDQADQARGTGADPCGRFTSEICVAWTEAATTGRISPATAELLRRSSPAAVAGNITAPTLLVQGEQDTLFGLDQADATARQIAAAGGRVKVEWFAGGHDGAAPDDAVRDSIGDWFDHHLAGEGDDPGTGFSYAVQSGVRAGANTPTSRVVSVPAYPGLPGAAPLVTTPLPLEGDPQQVVHPAGGNPAAITSLPGIGGALGSLAGRLSASADPPGQSATFRTAPLAAPLVAVGTPRVQVTISRVPGLPAPDEAVLYARITELSADGRRILLGGGVAPMRVPVPADGTPATVTVALPAVVAPVETGNQLAVSVGTTDQAFTGPVEPAVWQVGVTGDLTVPVVPADSAATASTVPPGPLLGLVGVLAVAALGWLIARLRRRRVTAHAASDDGPPLHVTGLAKTYSGGFQAVKDVSFTVEKGIVLGLLGPNGAGKTTVLRMLMGLVRPTAGSISAFGQPVGPGAPVLARIGAFVEGPGFLPHLSGRDNLRLYWAATGRPAEDAHVEEALEIAELGAALDRRVGTYSQGMRQRLAIAQAMLGLPDLLVLDEPTNGLDPPQISAMREVLRRYAARGRTVVVSSHLLAEVEQTCSHVVVMHRGEVVADGTVEEIIAGGGAATFTVDAPERAASVLSDLAGVRSVEVIDGGVHVELNGTPRAEAVRALVTAGVGVTAAGPRRRLEDAFLQLVGEDRTP